MSGTDDGNPLHDDEVLAELRAIGGTVPSVDLPWEAPPEGLWDRIAAEAGVDTQATVDAPDRTSVDGAGTAPFGGGPRGTAAGGDHHDDATGARPASSRRTSLGSDWWAEGEADATPDDARAPIPLRRGEDPAPNASATVPLAPRLLVAAAVLAVLVAGAALLAPRFGSEDDGAAVLAASDLEALTDRGSGHAELVDHDGRLELRVDVADLDPDDGFLEVWMIDPEVTGLVSLGPVRADGVYVLPPGMDPTAFPIVDVSVEPIDGDPGHSGASVLRTQLDL